MTPVITPNSKYIYIFSEICKMSYFVILELYFEVLTFLNDRKCTWQYEQNQYHHFWRRDYFQQKTCWMFLRSKYGVCEKKVVTTSVLWYMYMVYVYGICIWYMYMVYVYGICIWYMYMYMYMVYVYGNEPRPRGASFGPRVPAARYHIHIPYTYTIYIYHIRIPYTYTIYIYHIPYTYTIYIYHIHIPSTYTLYNGRTKMGEPMGEPKWENQCENQGP